MDPWFIRTELTEPLLDDSDFRAAVEAGHLGDAVGEPSDVSQAVAYLVRHLRDRTNIVCGRGPDLQRV